MIEKAYEHLYYDVRHIDTIKELVCGATELFPDKIAYLVKDERGGSYREITYKQFQRDVDALGTKLCQLGLKGKRIAIIGENCYDWVVAYFAVVNGTGIVVPLDKELSSGEIHKLLDIAECEAIFYTPTFRKTVDENKISMKIEMQFYDSLRKRENPFEIRNLIAEGEELLDGGDRNFIDAEIDPDIMSIMLFTSGTTGFAKAVMLSHKNIASNVMNTAMIYKLLPDERGLSTLPIHHTYESTINIMGFFYMGASVAFCEGLKYIVKNMQESQVTMLVTVPLVLENLHSKIWKSAQKSGKDGKLRKAIAVNNFLKKFGLDLSRSLFKEVHATFGGRLRRVLTGAASINPETSRGLQDFGIDIAQGYGLTETAPLVAGSPLFTNRYKKADSPGPAIPGMEVRIDNPDEKGIGEILVRGTSVMLGYYNMPEVTAEVIRDGWFYTGDLGYLDEENWIYITGRKKNVIVTSTGKNIYPEELENVLQHNPYIKECMVYGAMDEDGVNNTVSVQIIPDYEEIHEVHGNDITPEQIYNLIKAAVTEINQDWPNYKWIRNVIIRDTDFSKTTTHKIKRHENI